MGCNSCCIRNTLKKLAIIITILALLPLSLACKAEEEVVEIPLVVEEKLPYEKIEDISEEKFETLTSQVRDRIMVFDIAEVHEEIYPILKSSVDINTTDEKIEVQIEKILDPFMEKWTTDKIRDYLTEELGEVSVDDVERFRDEINNKSLIDLIIVYEKNFLKGKK
ncbi:MAG: hypothetical protein WBA54_14445 [Acidaminobacteraceae bacterium]